MCSKHTDIGVGLALLLLGAGYSALNWGPSGPPRLEAPGLPLHLGRGKPGQVLDGSIRLRNIGGQPLAFTLQTSCGCSDVRPRAGTLAPAEAVDIRLGVRLDTFGSQRDVRVTIVSNDPARPTVDVMVRAECPAPIQVRPAQVDFGPLSRSSSATVVLAAFDEEDRPFGPSSGLQAATADTWYDLRPAPGAGSALAWDVVLKEGLAVGTHVGEVRLRLPDGDQVEVPVRVEVLGAISVAPATLTLGGSAAAPGGKGTGTVLVWRPDGGPLGGLEGVNAPPGLEVREVCQLEDKRRRFQVQVMDEAPVGLQVVQLRFRECPEPASVRVVVLAARP